ncbi:glycoside hydrolase family 3 C-terminal domain-containing protein [Yinghuangia aomiensis]|uniref:Glycoside hydrolase family 3 C-terminal domain-containing protein n=1 Tax=Yinghuangia aomiensis TaxID=676205 RepID=A0ABP9HZT5_9ACTN
MHDATDIRLVVSALTLQEKARLLSGRGGWDTFAVERVAVPSIVLTDGPHGLRMQDPAAERFSFEASIPATCFPTAAALGSSWDVGLIGRIGEAVAAESRAAGVSVLLGPGVNIKRSPLCGRNFEYLSEDPLLSGHLGAAFVTGVQGAGVAASVKHFAANNQETDRMRIDARVDERTLREIYLAAFEHIVTTAKPWTVMAAYNKLNGVYATQNSWLLTEVLRDEWGFDGVVVSDWGAVTSPVAAVSAGLDLEMPSNNGASAESLVRAVTAGELDESVLDRAVTRLLELVGRTAPGREPGGAVDLDGHHALARIAAAESAVLLKNDHAILPLDPDADVSVAVIGEFARTPRYQGAGSSRVNATKVDNTLDAMTETAGQSMRLEFSPGFRLSGEEDPELLSAAVAAAGRADVAVLFLGLSEGVESEGHDRTDIELPADQRRLLEAVAEVNSRVVVVLANGGVVDVASWEGHAAAVLEGWLTGQAGGGAIADLLFGRANPCGRLAETIPLRLEDTPSFLDFPGSDSVVSYAERLYVGYRYYDARNMQVAYPFGHGLSYTAFEYSDLGTSIAGAGDGVAVRLRFTLTNSGSLPGKEVVQVYVGDPESSIDRPVRELKAFAKVELAPGASTQVEFELRARDFSFYSSTRGGWVLEAGDFDIHVGGSSRDCRLAARVTIDAPAQQAALTPDSTVGEWLAHPKAGPALLRAMSRVEGSAAASDPTVMRMVESLPLSRLVSMSGGRMDPEEIFGLFDAGEHV